MNIIEAIRDGDLASVQALVDVHNVNDNLLDGKGSRPLHVACMESLLHIVKWMVKIGANVNIRSSGNLTPLHIACKNGGVDIIIFLMQNGAEKSLHIEDVFGDTPIHLVRFCPHVDQPHLLKMFLESGADAQHRGDMDFISLHFYHHSIECMRILIDAYPAGVFSPAGGGQTALHEAAYSGSIASCELLLKAGSDVNASSNQRALFWAIFNQNAELVRLLLDYGVPIRGITPERYRWATTAQQESSRNMIEWAKGVVSQSEAFRASCLALLRLRRKRAQRICRNGRDILRIVARHLWAWRQADL